MQEEVEAEMAEAAVASVEGDASREGLRRVDREKNLRAAIAPERSRLGDLLEHLDRDLLDRPREGDRLLERERARLVDLFEEVDRLRLLVAVDRAARLPESGVGSRLGRTSEPTLVTLRVEDLSRVRRVEDEGLLLR